MKQPFSFRFVALLVALGLSTSCTGEKLAKLPRCDGGHKRDANPYGSILPGAPKPPVTAPATAGKPVAVIESGRGRVAVAPSHSYPSC